MPQSTFAASATQFIDAVDQTHAPSGVWNLGVSYLGGAKSGVRRCLGGFDLFGAAASGRALTPADAITSAELVLEVTSVIGTTGWAARVDRMTRADWDHSTANWTRYKTGANWSSFGGGGDVGTPPAAVVFASPSAAGEQIIAGMLEYVTDAIANRGGLVLLRLKADGEAPPVARLCAYDAALTASLRPRLRVTYEVSEAAAIARPEVQTLGAERGEPAARGDSAARADQPAQAAGGGPTTDDRRQTKAQHDVDSSLRSE